MSIKSKIAAIAAASIGMVVTQSSSLRAENNAIEKVTKIAADVDEEVLYSALPDEVLENAAAFGGVGPLRRHPKYLRRRPSLLQPSTS